MFRAKWLGATVNTELCERLAWDTEFFGRNIGRVRPSRLTPDQLAQINAWAESEQIDCLYYLCDPNCPVSARIAESAGFRLTDVRVTLRLSADVLTPDRHAAVRLAMPGDTEDLVRIAGEAHADSRFYYDERFSEPVCRALYETWIRRSLDGWAQAVLVADAEGPVGYITCHLGVEGAGSIGLLGVSATAQGQGLGRQLVAAARAWFHEQSAATVTVVTQGRNARAQRLYQRAGFVTADVGLWFHRWYDDAPASPRG